MQLRHYVELLAEAEERLAGAFATVADAHGDEPDVHSACRRLAAQCDEHAAALRHVARRYDDDGSEPPVGLHSDLFHGPRDGGLGLLRDLQDLYLMASECELVWTLVGQGAQGARDEELVGLVGRFDAETSMQLRWLRTRMKQAAPQALVVA